MNLVLREAAATDEAAVMAIWQACGLVRPWNDPGADFRRALAFAGSTLFLAELDGQAAGTAMVGFDGHRGWIYYLGVARAHRVKGLARRLLDACAEWLRRRDCPKVELMLREGNPAAGLYERLGWDRQPVQVYARWLSEGRESE
jgi:ribosomal protein S18 acetylase RimI-like enzyme